MAIIWDRFKVQIIILLCLLPAIFIVGYLLFYTEPSVDDTERARQRLDDAIEDAEQTMWEINNAERIERERQRLRYQQMMKKALEKDE